VGGSFSDRDGVAWFRLEVELPLICLFISGLSTKFKLADVFLALSQLIIVPNGTVRFDA